MAKKEKKYTDKRRKMLKYTRQTFMKVELTDEELFQLNEL